MALTVFKTVRDLTTSGWVGSIPMRSRHRSRFSGAVQFSVTIVHLLNKLSFVAVVVVAGFGRPLMAQRVDTVRAPVASSRADSLRVPISPRRAFFYSFMVPGYSQSVLGRHMAATAFLLVEAISIAMIRESGADKREARRLANDTVIVSYIDASGNPGIITAPPQFNSAYVRTRAAHVEDWVALLVANHLFAGADAFVAANLWDVAAHVGLRVSPNGTALTASFKW